MKDTWNKTDDKIKKSDWVAAAVHAAVPGAAVVVSAPEAALTLVIVVAVSLAEATRSVFRAAGPVISCWVAMSR